MIQVTKLSTHAYLLNVIAMHYNAVIQMEFTRSTYVVRRSFNIQSSNMYQYRVAQDV